MLFGVLLCGLVVWRFRGWLKSCLPSEPAEARAFSRQLSRMVYLVLYLVIGIRQSVEMVNARWLGVTFEPTAYCQSILAYGLIALILIRVAAYRFGLKYRVQLNRS